jgi:hypothetical protein
MHRRLPCAMRAVCAVDGRNLSGALRAPLACLVPVWGAAASPGSPQGSLPGVALQVTAAALAILGGVALVAYALRNPRGALRAVAGSVLAVAAIASGLAALYVFRHPVVELQSNSPLPGERRLAATTSPTVQELHLPAWWTVGSSGEPASDPAPRLQAWLDPLGADGTTTLWVELRTAAGWEIACPLQPHVGPSGVPAFAGPGSRGLFLLSHEGVASSADISAATFGGAGKPVSGIIFQQRGAAQSALGMQTRRTPLGEQVLVYPQRALWHVPLQALPVRGPSTGGTGEPAAEGHLSTELFAFRPSQGMWLRCEYHEPFVARLRGAGSAYGFGGAGPDLLAVGSGAPGSGHVGDASAGAAGSPSRGVAASAPVAPSVAAGAAPGAVAGPTTGAVGATRGAVASSSNSADWIQRPDYVRDGVLHTTARTGFAAADDPSLAAELNRAVLQRVQAYVAELVAADVRGKLDIPLDYVRQHVWKDTHREQRDFESAGDNMVRLHARLEFDGTVSQHLRRQWDELLARNRVVFAAGGAGLLLGVLATLYGYLRLDTLSRGYYTGRLRLAALAVLAALTAAGYRLWEAFQSLSLGG